MTLRTVKLATPKQLFSNVPNQKLTLLTLKLCNAYRWKTMKSWQLFRKLTKALLIDEALHNGNICHDQTYQKGW